MSEVDVVSRATAGPAAVDMAAVDTATADTAIEVSERVWLSRLRLNPRHADSAGAMRDA